MSDLSLQRGAGPRTVSFLALARAMARAPVARLARWVAHRRRRTLLRDLLALEDSLLFDIGVTREEVEGAVRLPLAENAALHLHHRARARRRAQGSG